MDRESSVRSAKFSRFKVIVAQSVSNNNKPVIVSSYKLRLFSSCHDPKGAVGSFLFGLKGYMQLDRVLFSGYWVLDGVYNRVIFVPRPLKECKV